jgi:N-acyl-D-amino-acid deacylase
LAQLETARQEGVDVSFDMYPYLAGSSYMLQLRRRKPWRAVFPL